jgi:iron complex transport system permease protein
VNRLNAKQCVGLAALIVAAAALALLRIMIYRDPVSGEIEFGWPDEVVRQYRWTPVVVGIVVGASLAISGVLLQALLRNPLAEPFILGLSSGAGLGVMAWMFSMYALGEAGAWMGGARSVAAIAGGLLTLAVVYALGQRRGMLDPISLILVGVIISAICGAGIMFFQHLVPTGLSGEFTLWLMGHIPLVVKSSALISAIALMLCGLILSVLLGRAMDASTFGDDEARSIGLAIGPLRAVMFVMAGLLAAVTVSLAGPIGFVGLIGPHAARLLLGPRHTLLVIGAAICGIILIIGADVARQVLDLGAGRMPIGIFTALIGGPAFIWLLLTGRGQA